MRLLALPPLPQELLWSLFGDERVELVVPPFRTQETVDLLLPEVDLVLGDWSGLRVTDPGPRVRFVQQPSAGVDAVDVAACTARGVPVSNCAGANAVSVAEWCLSAALALLRKTVQADASLRRGEWLQTSLGGRELSGLRVGVVGMGAIGTRVASLFSAVGCQVSYWSRRQHPGAPAPYAALEDLVAGSDVIVLVIALGDATRGLFGAELIGRMKPGALLINGARGEVVDDGAFAAAVTEGRIHGATDVYAVEPLPEDSVLRRAPGLLLSPHMAGSTVEAAMRIVGQSKANLVRALDGVPVVDVVNGVDSVIRAR